MKTVLGNENKFQDNHWWCKSTAADQAVSELRSSRCFIMLGVDFLGRVQVLPEPISCLVFSHRYGSRNCGTEDRGTPKA